MADFHGRLLWPTFVADFSRLWPTFMADWPTPQSAGHFTVWPADGGRQKSASGYVERKNRFVLCMDAGYFPPAHELETDICTEFSYVI